LVCGGLFHYTQKIIGDGSGALKISAEDGPVPGRPEAAVDSAKAAARIVLDNFIFLFLVFLSLLVK